MPGYRKVTSAGMQPGVGAPYAIPNIAGYRYTTSAGMQRLTGGGRPHAPINGINKIPVQYSVGVVYHHPQRQVTGSEKRNRPHFSGDVPPHQPGASMLPPARSCV